jgi:hypothetical protein
MKFREQIQIEKNNRYFVKIWKKKEAEKERVHERLQRIYNIIIDFYGEEMINEIIIFYQNLWPNGVVDNFSDEDIDIQ